MIDADRIVGHGGYVINDAALGYMRRHGLARSAIAVLARHPRRRFADEVTWRAHLERLGLGASRDLTEAARVTTEGALWGRIIDLGLLGRAVIISNGAAQFNVGHHARCWVHAERLIHSLIGFSDEQRAAPERIRRGCGGSTPTSRPTAAIRPRLASARSAGGSIASLRRAPRL